MKFQDRTKNVEILAIDSLTRYRCLNYRAVWYCGKVYNVALDETSIERETLYLVRWNSSGLRTLVRGSHAMAFFLLWISEKEILGRQRRFQALDGRNGFVQLFQERECAPRDTATNVDSREARNFSANPVIFGNAYIVCRVQLVRDCSRGSSS